MTLQQAVYSFISGIFGTGVPSGSVYSGALRPLIPHAVYSAPVSPVFGAKTEGFIDYYYFDEKNCGAAAHDALAEFAAQVGMEGKTLDFDGGRLYITRAEPFYTLTADKRDQSRKCVRLKLNFSFIDPKQSLVLSDGSTSYTIDSRSQIAITSSLVGSRAESVSGASIMDYLGTKAAVSVKTCWLEKTEAAGITRLIASSPVLTLSISDLFVSPDPGEYSARFMFDMPKVTARAYEPESGREYVKLEINAVEQGLSLKA